MVRDAAELAVERNEAGRELGRARRKVEGRISSGCTRGKRGWIDKRGGQWTKSERGEPSRADSTEEDGTCRNEVFLGGGVESV